MGNLLATRNALRRTSCIQGSREMQIQQLCCRIGSKCFSLALSKNWLWVVWLRLAVFLARLDKLFGLACQLFACSFQNRLGRQRRHGTPLPTQNSSNWTANRGKTASQVDSHCMSCPERKHRPDIACHILSVSFHYVTRRQNTSLLLRDLIHLLHCHRDLRNVMKVLPLIAMIPTLFFACYLPFAPVLLHTTADFTRGPIHATVSIFFFCTAWAFEAWQRSQASNIWNHYMESWVRRVLSCCIMLYYAVLQDLHGFTALCHLYRLFICYKLWYLGVPCWTWSITWALPSATLE